MRRWWIALAVVLLVAACHRKPKEAPADSVPVAPSMEVDTIAPPPDDTVPPSPQQPLNTQLDSAEITNLRLFARKQRTIYNPELLVGEWTRGTEHEEYFADGTGRMWDESEDVVHSEAKQFEWTMDSNLLTVIFRTELGGIVPRRYVVTFADDESLSYKDYYGFAWLWDKKQQ